MCESLEIPQSYEHPNGVHMSLGWSNSENFLAPVRVARSSHRSKFSSSACASAVNTIPNSCNARERSSSDVSRACVVHCCATARSFSTMLLTIDHDADCRRLLELAIKAVLSFQIKNLIFLTNLTAKARTWSDQSLPVSSCGSGSYPGPSSKRASECCTFGITQKPCNF